MSWTKFFGRRFIALALVFHISPAFGEIFAQPEAQVAPAAQDCNQPNVVDKGDSSPNKAHFEKILDKAAAGLDNISLDSLLQLWYPKRGNGLNLSSPYFACEAEEMGAFRYSEGGKPEPSADCRPDVVYSWGPVHKSNDVFANMSDNGKWSGFPNRGSISEGNVFASISAVSTFGFGDRLLRFKIKPNAQYVFRGGWGAEHNKLTIRTGFFHDFAFKDADLIESVATGTPEIYDEVVRDILHFQSGKRVSAYNKNGGTGLGRLFSQAVDGNNQSELRLKRNLVEMIRQILHGEGKIHYSSGACRNRDRVFISSKPSYLRPPPAATP